MKNLLLFGCAVLLTTTSFLSVGLADVKDLEPADFVVEDLTRWKNLPIFSLPGFNFERLTITGKYTRGSGEPSAPRKVEMQVISKNGGVTLLGVRSGGAGIEERNYVGSYIGTLQLSTSASGRSGKWTRRILNLTFMKNIPVDPKIIKETPQIHGVNAKDLSYELEYNIRIGGGRDRTFSVTNKVIGTEIVEVKVNGDSYQLDSYVIKIVMKNKYVNWKRTSTIRYIPALGYRGRAESNTEWQGGRSRNRMDDFRYVVSDDQLKHLNKLAEK